MLKDAKVMSVVDANKGFFQIPLDEESKLLTAMSTPYGVYIFNVLAMGLSLASDNNNNNNNLFTYRNLQVSCFFLSFTIYKNCDALFNYLF